MENVILKGLLCFMKLNNLTRLKSEKDSSNGDIAIYDDYIEVNSNGLVEFFEYVDALMKLDLNITLHNIECIPISLSNPDHCYGHIFRVDVSEIIGCLDYYDIDIGIEYTEE